MKKKICVNFSFFLLHNPLYVQFVIRIQENCKERLRSFLCDFIQNLTFFEKVLVEFDAEKEQMNPKEEVVF